MLSAVIRISNFGESPEPAVKSIIANKDRFKEVHFIYPSFQSEEESMYLGWKDDKINLGEHIRVLFHVMLHAHLLDPDCIIVEIPPNCEMKQGAFTKIQNIMRSLDTKQNTCSLASTNSLPQGSFWVGFFIILNVIETIWNRLFERGKLIEYTDVKAYFLLKKGKVAYFPDSGGYLFNSGTVPKVYSDGTAVLKQNFASVYEHLMWRLHNHANLKLMGLWIFPYSINYFILAISWPAILRGAIAFDNVYFASYVLLVYFVEVIFSYWIGSYYIKTPKRLVYSLLFPIYWALFPWILIYARLTVPQKTWD
jgi:hypothetical protein